MSSYRLYKTTGNDWISEIPSHWELVPMTKYLESIIDYRGKTPTKTDEGVFLVTARNIKSGCIDYSLSQEYVLEEEFEKTMSRGKLLIGDVLFTTEAPLGQVANVDRTDVAVAQRVIKFRGKPNVLNNYFLKYWILSSQFQQDLYSYSTGSTAIGIKSSKLHHLKLSLPSHEEQIPIVYFLDKKTSQIDKLISNKQKLIGLLKEERVAIINDAVSGEGKNWVNKKLKYVVVLRDELIDNADFKISVENIETATGRLVNMEVDKNYEGKLLAFKKSDTIFNKLRPYLHKVYFAEQDGGLYGELLIVNSMGELTSEFLFFKLFSKDFINIVDGSTQGTKMPRANWNDFISQMVVSFPKDKKEQTSIVQHIQTEIQRIDNTISKIKNEIELMNEYRTVLISEVVTGKIKVS